MKEIKSVKDRNLDAFKEFFDKLYGVDLDYTKTKEYKAYVESVEDASRKFKEDFDVMITIKHRYGDFKLKGIDNYTSPKSILEIIEKGITLPDDVNSFEIIARIAYYKHGKRKFLKKQDDIIFSHKVLLTDEVENRQEVENIVGQPVEKIDKKIRVFSRDELESFSDIIRFREAKNENELDV